MTDYISREVLIEHLRKDPLFDLVERYGITGVINFIPAADVRPVVKAKIADMRYTEDDGEWKCSHCGWQYTLCVCGKDVTAKIHFCPNCGADMREEN